MNAINKIVIIESWNPQKECQLTFKKGSIYFRHCHSPLTDTPDSETQSKAAVCANEILQMMPKLLPSITVALEKILKEHSKSPKKLTFVSLNTTGGKEQATLPEKGERMFPKFDLIRHFILKDIPEDQTKPIEFKEVIVPFNYKPQNVFRYFAQSRTLVSLHRHGRFSTLTRRNLTSLKEMAEKLNKCMEEMKAGALSFPQFKDQIELAIKDDEEKLHKIEAKIKRLEAKPTQKSDEDLNTLGYGWSLLSNVSAPSEENIFDFSKEKISKRKKAPVKLGSDLEESQLKKIKLESMDDSTDDELLIFDRAKTE